MAKTRTPPASSENVIVPVTLLPDVERSVAVAVRPDPAAPAAASVVSASLDADPPQPARATREIVSAIDRNAPCTVMSGLLA
jgi:hypothetical protein